MSIGGWSNCYCRTPWFTRNRGLSYGLGGRRLAAFKLVFNGLDQGRFGEGFIVVVVDLVVAHGVLLGTREPVCHGLAGNAGVSAVRMMLVSRLALRL